MEINHYGFGDPITMKKAMKRIVILLVIIGIAIGSIVGILFGLGVLGGLGGTGTATYTTYKFDWYDALNEEDLTDEVTAAWYAVDVSNIDDPDDLKDLVYSDFTADKTDEHTEFTPEADTEYVVHVTADVTPDLYCDIWLTTNPLIGNGELIPIYLGMNNISLYNVTADVGMAAFETITLGTTVAATNLRDWTIMVNCLDASEGATADITNELGFFSRYDFQNAAKNYTVIKVTFASDGGAAAAWCDFESAYDFTEVVDAANNCTYYEVNSILTSGDTYEIKFGSTIGTSFEAASIAIGYGSSASFTQWDVQT